MPELASFDILNSEKFYEYEEEILDLNGIALPNRFSKYEISYFFIKNTTNIFF